MMEWLLYVAVYLGIAFISSIFMTSSSYKSLLKSSEPVNTKDAWGHIRSQDIIDGEEYARRKNLSAKARKWGFWLGMLWILIIPAEILMGLYAGMSKIHAQLSIEPHDREFTTKKELYAAQKIVDKYNEEQKTKFDKELES